MYGLQPHPILGPRTWNPSEVHEPNNGGRIMRDSGAATKSTKLKDRGVWWFYASKSFGGYITTFVPWKGDIP